MSTTVTQVQLEHSEFLPDAYPPFPEGLESIELETISLSKLQGGNEIEEDRVFEICKSRGFFYLDISDSNEQQLKTMSEDIARLAEEVFRLPLKEKSSYLPLKTTKVAIHGYKCAGTLVTDTNGTRETAEFFGIPKNDIILHRPEVEFPSVISNNQDMLRDYTTKAHSTGLLILSVLAKKLNLPRDTFANLHRLGEDSGDHIRLTRGPPRKTPDLPEIQTPGHTDFGTITLLFNWLGGLQIWSEPNRGKSGFGNVVDPTGGDARWLWVKPKRGHLIVNLGDAAVKFTNGLLCSGRHRVVPAPGEQGLWPRYSVVYFVRPEDKVVLKALRSPGVIEPPETEEEALAGDWIIQQARAMLADKFRPAGASH